MTTAYFFINNTPYGSVDIPAHWYQPTQHMALLCPECGEVWARVIYHGNGELRHHAKSAVCRKHLPQRKFTSWSSIPGSLRDDFCQPSPRNLLSPEAMRWELECLMDWFEHTETLLKGNSND